MLSSASQACPDLALQQTWSVCTGPGGGRGVGSLTRGNLRERWLSRGVRDTTILRTLRWQVQRETPWVDTCCLHQPRLSLAKPRKVGAGGEPGFHVHLLPCGPVSTPSLSFVLHCLHLLQALSFPTLVCHSSCLFLLRFSPHLFPLNLSEHIFSKTQTSEGPQS